jgi:hypothetical protein
MTFFEGASFPTGVDALDKNSLILQYLHDFLKITDFDEKCRIFYTKNDKSAIKNGVGKSHFIRKIGFLPKIRFLNKKSTKKKFFFVFFQNSFSVSKLFGQL